ncbi:MAG: DUF1501 domain-containing protein [Rhodobacterales bacterium]|nr:DUF1501 domain-containing protein [Rhodobacterales bacterium]
MELTRRQILAASAASMTLGLPGTARAAVTTPRHFILVFLAGGWDTSYSIDPKSPDDVDGPWIFSENTGSDVEYTRQYHDFDIQLNDGLRPSITNFFDRWSGEENRVSLVRGVLNGAIAHETARPRALTGTPLGLNPDLHVIIGNGLAADLPLGSVDLSGMSHTGGLAASSGKMGFQSQMGAVLDPYRSFAAVDGQPAYPRFVPKEIDEDAIQTLLKKRNSRFREARSDGGKNDHLLDARLEAMGRSVRFQRESGALLEDVVPGEQMDFQAQLELATGLLSNGLCASVMVEARKRFDTHTDNAQQGGLQNRTFTALDGLGELLTNTLDSTGQPLIESTLVLVTSEMTRTPLLNSKAGKDHWPHCSSLLLGGGFQPGRLFGGTTNVAESLPTDFATGAVDPLGTTIGYDHFAAGIVQMMGLDPGAYFPSVVPFSPYLVS